MCKHYPCPNRLSMLLSPIGAYCTMVQYYFLFGIEVQSMLRMKTLSIQEADVEL